MGQLTEVASLVPSRAILNHQLIGESCQLCAKSLPRLKDPEISEAPVLCMTNGEAFEGNREEGTLHNVCEAEPGMANTCYLGP